MLRVLRSALCVPDMGAHEGVTVAGQAGMVMTALSSELFTHGGRVFHFSSLMGSQRRWPLGQGASALCLIINSTTDGRMGGKDRKTKGQTT